MKLRDLESTMSILKNNLKVVDVKMEKMVETNESGKRLTALEAGRRGRGAGRQDTRKFLAIDRGNNHDCPLWTKPVHGLLGIVNGHVQPQVSTI
jgi:hypothetical protein